MPTLRTTYPLTDDQTTGAAVLCAGTEASRAAMRLGARIVGPVDWHWTPDLLVGMAPIRWNADLDTSHGHRLDAFDEEAVRRVVAGEQPWTVLRCDPERTEVVRRLAARGYGPGGIANVARANTDAIRPYLARLSALGEAAA